MMAIYRRTRRKNARKAAILGVLARAEGPLSYVQVAGAVGIYPVSQVARDLQRYARFGYVRRWKAAGKYRYEITRRGLERLAYFTRSTPKVRRGIPFGAPETSGTFA
jgi:DNA-binding IclR family transcriptional regulator